MIQVEFAGPLHETFRRLLVGLGLGSTSPAGARYYIYVRSLPAVSGTRAPIRKSLPAELSLFEQAKAVPALVQICRAARPDQRNRARFPLGSVRVQRPARSLSPAEVWRGKIA